MSTVRERFRALGPAARARVLQGLDAGEAAAWDGAWGEWAHAGQVCPAGKWRTWVVMAGRGFGKTRAGAEWVLEGVRSFDRPRMSGASARAAEPLPHRAAPGGPALPSADLRFPRDKLGEELRIALVAATVDEARRVMVEGPSGLLACARAGEVLDWCPSRRELRLNSPNLGGGAVATLFSGANPEALRGPQHHFAWCDELAKWRHAQATWDMLQLGLRCGARPRALVTTTPRGGCAALAAILAAEGTMVTRGRLHDNPHLPAAFVRAVEATYGGTRMGREEIDGEFVAEVAGSLWPAALLARCRGAAPGRAALARVVVGVDPPAGPEGTCGIVACGLDGDGVGWVLGDHSAAGLSPEGWARRVAAAVEVHAADRVVAEGNQGGEMVRSVLRAAGIALPVTLVAATAGKGARAEPVAGLFECGRARLGGRFAELEAELAAMVPAGYAGAGGSPDRADAMVWALWALCLAPRAEPRVRAM
jgi:phage terminase large subunit-like protein